MQKKISDFLLSKQIFEKVPKSKMQSLVNNMNKISMEIKENKDIIIIREDLEGLILQIYDTLDSIEVKKSSKNRSFNEKINNDNKLNQILKSFSDNILGNTDIY